MCIRAPAYLRLLEDVPGHSVQIGQVFDGGHVLRHGLNHYLTRRQNQLVRLHLRTKRWRKEEKREGRDRNKNGERGEGDSEGSGRGGGA